MGARLEAPLAESMRGEGRHALAALDREVLGRADDHFRAFESHGRARRRARLVRIAGAAAAVVLLAAIVPVLLTREGSSTTTLAGDLDNSGTIDMLDAYRLAMLVQDGGAIDTVHDLTADGLIDDRDVDAVAAHAVRMDAVAHNEQQSPDGADTDRERGA